jgi:hypothetical protein
MKGKFLVIRHRADKDIMAVDPFSDNGTIAGIATGVARFGEPLDITQNCKGSEIRHVSKLGVATTSHCSGRSLDHEASPR